MLTHFLNDESGQDLIEYALLAAFISLVAVISVQSVGTGVNGIYGQIASTFPLAP